LWLSPFLYCAQCGRCLSAWNQRGTLQYCCPQYRKYGKSNATGCGLFVVPHALAERLVECYLDEGHAKLSSLLAIDGEEQLLTALDQEIDRTQMAYVKLMTRIWQEVKTAGAAPPPGKPWSHSSLVTAYRVTQTTGRQKLAQQLQGKQVQM